MSSVLRALVLGDVVGQPGCRALFVSLQSLIRQYSADLVVANGENAAAGFGITPDIAEQMFTSGIHVITSGNHIWQKRDIYPMLENNPRLLRPSNYPQGVVGKGSCALEIKGQTVAVMNLQGRENLSTIQCPFRTGKEQAKKLREKAKIIIVDFHAESADEKESLGIYLDGQVSAVLGTHTHVQTADERILKHGTAYMTDLGMTGPSDSVIGISKEIAIDRSMTQMPLKMEVAENTAFVSGALLTLDCETGRALKIERVNQKSIV